MYDVIKRMIIRAEENNDFDLADDDYVDVEYIEDYQLDAEDLVDLQEDEYAVKTTLWLLLQRLQKESSLF